LKITANHLRAAQGLVRCGDCNKVFNAMLSLSDAPFVQVQAKREPEQARAQHAKRRELPSVLDSSQRPDIPGDPMAVKIA
jgi:predicted Zn finger-like uncharacterized protein